MKQLALRVSIAWLTQLGQTEHHLVRLSCIYFKSRLDKSLDLEGLVRASNITSFRDSNFKETLSLSSKFDIYKMSPCEHPMYKNTLIEVICC